MLARDMDSIFLVWLPLISRWGGDTIRDGDILRRLIGKRYFTDAEYDEVLNTASREGYDLATYVEGTRVRANPRNRGAGRSKRNPVSGGRGWEVGPMSPPMVRIPRRRPEPQRSSGRRYEYWPGAMDIADPNMISGHRIDRGAIVTITRDRVDPMGKIVWITDEEGNEQSVWRAALRPVGTGKRFRR